ncbi:hypothetical protein RRG08_048638 [Elysia crispata]|uniref:Uncharacterized protein n=1 Tax=Elysia crispata TaxID=231223 RepID=A0AAE1DWG3_9GAST|nr:hypothetical protein RRG08_048638 [Elysia crispata]
MPRRCSMIDAILMFSRTADIQPRSLDTVFDGFGCGNVEDQNAGDRVKIRLQTIEPLLAVRDNGKVGSSAVSQDQLQASNNLGSPWVYLVIIPFSVGTTNIKARSGSFRVTRFTGYEERLRFWGGNHARHINETCGEWLLKSDARLSEYNSCSAGPNSVPFENPTGPVRQGETKMMSHLLPCSDTHLKTTKGAEPDRKASTDLRGL